MLQAQMYLHGLILFHSQLKMKMAVTVVVNCIKYYYNHYIAILLADIFILLISHSFL